MTSISKQVSTQPTHTQQGFTLLEVMVALAILAVISVAASQASASYLRSIDNLRTRTLAHFVAQNAAAELQISQTWITAEQNKKINAQGRDWQLTYTPKDTPSPNLKSVEVSVAPIDEDKVKNSVTSVQIVIRNPNQNDNLGLLGQ